MTSFKNADIDDLFNNYESEVSDFFDDIAERCTKNENEDKSIEQDTGLVEHSDSNICEKCWGRGKVYNRITRKVEDCECTHKKLDIKGAPQVEESHLTIPAQYKGIVFNKNLIANYNNSAYEFFVSTLEEVYSEIIANKLIKTSLFIYAEPNNGKSSWVYACMQECLRAGMSTYNYKDTSEISKLLYISEEEQLISSVDYLFCKVKVAGVTKQDLDTICILLDKRAREGKPTIIVSRFSKTNLLSVDPHSYLRDLLIEPSSGFLNGNYCLNKLVYISKGTANIDKSIYKYIVTHTVVNDRGSIVGYIIKYKSDDSKFYLSKFEESDFEIAEQGLIENAIAMTGPNGNKYLVKRSGCASLSLLPSIHYSEIGDLRSSKID